MDILVSQYLTHHIADEVLEVRPFRLLAEGACGVHPMDHIVTRVTGAGVSSIEGGQGTLDGIPQESPL